MGQYMQADANYFNGAYDAEIVPPQPDSRGMLVDCTKRLSAQDQKELRGYFEGCRPKEACVKFYDYHWEINESLGKKVKYFYANAFG